MKAENKALNEALRAEKEALKVEQQNKELHAREKTLQAEQSQEETLKPSQDEQVVTTLHGRKFNITDLGSHDEGEAADDVEGRVEPGEGKGTSENTDLEEDGGWTEVSKEEQEAQEEEAENEAVRKTTEPTDTPEEGSVKRKEHNIQL